MNTLAPLPDGTSELPKATLNNSGRFTELDPDKLRGGYYTPKQLADWMCKWAIRSPSDSVLEPSCGDGTFLHSASERLVQLGRSGPGQANQLCGVELIPAEAKKARQKLRENLGFRAADSVTNHDFFSWWKINNNPRFNSIVGNPPFIRYQSFPEPHRSRAMEIMSLQGLKPNRLTNIWVPFVVAASTLLQPGGRMALVIPAELLQVGYAAQLRSFLTERFERIDLITCNELFFDNAQQEVLLLLAHGARAPESFNSPCSVTLTEYGTISDIINKEPIDIVSHSEPKIVCHDSEKWLKYFLEPSEISLIRQLRETKSALPLSTYATVNVGVVTGKNQFFVLKKSEIDQHGIKPYVTKLGNL